MEELKHTRISRRIAAILVCSIALSVVCSAQNKPVEKPKGKKDNTEAAWKQQAQSVAEEIGLTKNQTAKLTDAYVAAKRSHKQALKAMPEEKEKDKSRAATQAAIEKDQAKFVSSLKGVLTEDNISKILPTLGTFNTKWDGFVAALQNLKLDKAKMNSAMKLVIKYVADSEAANAEMMKTSNRKANSKPFKEALDAGLAGVLNADQIKAWKEATTSATSKDKGASTDKGNKNDKTEETKKK